MKEEVEKLKNLKLQLFEVHIKEEKSFQYTFTLMQYV